MKTFKFSKKEIQDEFDDGSFSRGFNYFRTGKVHSILSKKMPGNAIEIESKVNGSYLYSQSIFVERNPWGIDVEGECSCPVGFNCKHVVAVLFEYLHSTPDHSTNNPFKRLQSKKNSYADKPELDVWISNFAQLALNPDEHFLKNERKWLAYILNPARIFGEISISFFQSGYKVSGGYYKTKPIQGYSISDSIKYNSSAPYLNIIDSEIIRLLDVSNTQAYYSPLTLQGEFGWQALKKMVNTRRCFWQSMDANPLTLAPSRPLNLSWKENKANNTTLYQLHPDYSQSEFLILTEPPALINTELNCIIPLTTNLKTQQLKQLLSMPPITKKNLENFNLGMIKNRLDKNMPLPLPTKILELSAKKITPKAIISKIKDPTGKLPDLHCLMISFLYDKMEVQLFDDMTLVKQQKNSIARIQRDYDVEKEILNPLNELGFVLSRSFDENGTHNNKMAALLATEQTAIESIGRWKNFLDVERWELEKTGWKIEMADDFYLDFVQPMDEWDIDISEGNDWFELKFDIRLSDSESSKIPLLPIVTQLLNEYEINNIPDEILVENTPGQYLVLPKKKLQPILELIYELFDSVSLGAESIKLSAFDALLLHHLDNNMDLDIQWSGDQRIKEIGKKLANFDGIKKVLPAKKFKGKLRDYQTQGLSWLQFLREFSFSGILADDMGLGKTVQTLVHLQKEKMARRMKSPCLIVAPTSLMSNWKREVNQFTPNLSVLILQGSNRQQHFDYLTDYDLILTTYPLIVRDFEILSKLEFYTIVLDEAQNIKNPKSKATKGLKLLKTQHRLALTGTPMENHLGELWSIFDFLMPGFLGSESAFKKKYRNPIEKDNDPLIAKMLAKRVKPFLLRRSKQVVVSELPPKTEIIKTVTFENAQSILYETIRLSMEKKIQQAIAKKGLNRSHITILDALLKLRQVCCDPQLVKLSQAKKVKQSAKMELLITMLPELIEEGRKVLIFSQFTSMLAIIEDALNSQKISYSKLTGRTRKRDEVIEKFTSGKVDVFLISLKAGGVGLNLTEADTVIHYDPWWNPAVENQASDRAHRIGQNKPVFVYKLVVENTLEEKILEMQQKKQALADGLYGDKTAADSTKLTAKDLEELLGIVSSN